MRRIVSFVLAIAFLFVALVSCVSNDSLIYESNESDVQSEESLKHPLDCYNSEWVNIRSGISFKVSDDGKAFDAKATDCDGKIHDVAVLFSGNDRSDVVVKSLNSDEVYFSGTCVLHKEKFAINVTDIFDKGFSHLSLRLFFEQK